MLGMIYNCVAVVQKSCRLCLHISQWDGHSKFLKTVIKCNVNAKWDTKESPMCETPITVDAVGTRSCNITLFQSKYIFFYILSIVT